MFWLSMSSSVPSQRSFAEPVFCIRASTVMLLRFEGSKSRLRMRISETVYSNGRCIVRSRTVTRPFEISRSAIRSVGLGVALPAASDAVISAAGDFIRAARLLPSGVISNSAESPET